MYDTFQSKLTCDSVTLIHVEVMNVDQIGIKATEPAATVNGTQDFEQRYKQAVRPMAYAIAKPAFQVYVCWPYIPEVRIGELRRTFCGCLSPVGKYGEPH